MRREKGGRGNEEEEEGDGLTKNHFRKKESKERLFLEGNYSVLPPSLFSDRRLMARTNERYHHRRSGCSLSYGGGQW